MRCNSQYVCMRVYWKNKFTRDFASHFGVSWTHSATKCGEQDTLQLRYVDRNVPSTLLVGKSLNRKLGIVGLSEYNFYWISASCLCGVASCWICYPPSSPWGFKVNLGLPLASLPYPMSSRPISIFPSFAGVTGYWLLHYLTADMHWH